MLLLFNIWYSGKGSLKIRLAGNLRMILNLHTPPSSLEDKALMEGALIQGNSIFTVYFYVLFSSLSFLFLLIDGDKLEEC